MGVRSQRHAQAPPPAKETRTHCMGGWLDPRARLEGRGKSRRNGVRSPHRPARSESQYRLSDPGPQNLQRFKLILDRKLMCVPFVVFRLLCSVRGKHYLKLVRCKMHAVH
jgi:hypothetical protein